MNTGPAEGGIIRVHGSRARRMRRPGMTIKEAVSMKAVSPTARLQKLIHRTNKVLAVLHPPTAAHARIMERAGCEAGFVGTGGVVGSYMGLADVGTMGMMECVQVAGWIAQAVDFPVMMDGDTGHGGVMAIRRMI